MDMKHLGQLFVLFAVFSMPMVLAMNAAGQLESSDLEQSTIIKRFTGGARPMVATAISRPRRQFNPFGGYGGGFPGMGMQQPPSQQNQQSSNQVVVVSQNSQQQQQQQPQLPPWMQGMMGR